MIMWSAHTTSACVFSLKSGGLHMAWWRFQFWLSLSRWLCYLCKRYPGVCGNISSPVHVSFFQCLPLCSTFDMHVKKMDRVMERISLILDDDDVLVVPNDFFNLVTAAVVWAILESTSGLDPSSDTKDPRYLKLCTVFGFLLSMVMSVLMPLVLFVIDLHAICCGGLFRVIYQLDQLLLLSS